MKISKKQKQENRELIIAAGTKLIAKRGLQKVTMREIAAHCKMSDPTIYNYFESKEDLALGAYAFVIEQALKSTADAKCLGPLTCTNQLHILVMDVLEQLAKINTFVEQTFSDIFLRTPGLSEVTQRLRQQVSSEVRKILEHAEAAGEIATNPLKDLTAHLFWDYLLGIIFYWSKDESKDKSRTLEMVEKSILIIGDILKVQLIEHTLGMAQFLIREHLIFRVFGSQK